MTMFLTLELVLLNSRSLLGIRVRSVDVGSSLDRGLFIQLLVFRNIALELRLLGGGLLRPGRRKRRALALSLGGAGPCRRSILLSTGLGGRSISARDGRGRDGGARGGDGWNFTSEAGGLHSMSFEETLDTLLAVMQLQCQQHALSGVNGSSIIRSTHAAGPLTISRSLATAT